MKKLLACLRKDVQLWHERRAERLEIRRSQRLDSEARRVVQVMEFEGELYVSVHGVPLFSRDVVSTGDLIRAVEKGRAAYKNYKESKLWETGTTGAFIRY